MHVTPSQQGVGIQNQCHHPRHNGRGSRGAAKDVGVVPVEQSVVAHTQACDIGRDRAGRCTDQYVRPIGGITGDVPVRFDRGHGHAVLRSVQAIAIAVGIVVACRLDGDGAQATATEHRRIVELLHIGSGVEVGHSTVAVVGDIKILQGIQRQQVAIPIEVDVIRSTKDGHTRDAAVKGDAHAPDTVVVCRNQAGDRCAVDIGGRQGLTRVDLTIDRDEQRAEKIGAQIPLGGLHSRVPDTHTYVRTGVAGPYPLQACGVVAASKAEASNHGQVPLAGVQRVCRFQYCNRH